MNCSTCPLGAGPCLGESAPRLCELARTRLDYRRLLIEQASESVALDGSMPIDLDSILNVISSCPERGPVLPTALQPECGCSELSECRAGRGRTSGRVTLQDCLACVFQRSRTAQRLAGLPSAG